MKTLKDIWDLKRDMLSNDNVLRGVNNLLHDVNKDSFLYARLLEDKERLMNEAYTLEKVLKSVVINDDLKDVYIISELKNIVWTIDREQFDDILNDYPQGPDYMDAGLNWIYDYLYELFDSATTLDEIDDAIYTVFNHYNSNLIAHHDGAYYLFLEY